MLFNIFSKYSVIHRSYTTNTIDTILLPDYYLLDKIIYNNKFDLTFSGGLLHLHDLSMTSPEWLIKNATYRADCYMCKNASTGQTLFKLLKPAPEDTSGWFSSISMPSNFVIRFGNNQLIVHCVVYIHRHDF